MNRGVLVALAVVVAAAGGFLVYRMLPPPLAADAKVQISDQDAKSADNAAADADAALAEAEKASEQKIATVLPHFTLVDRDGKKRSLQEWSGRPLMVNFWATWCPPCRKEIPLLNQIRTKYSAQRLEVVGVAVDFVDDVLAYAKENPINYPLLIGEEDGMEAMKAFGMAGAGFPFTFFADSKQRVVGMRLGELHQDEADFILERLFAVDAGKLDIEVAKKEITEGVNAMIIRRKAAEAAATPEKASTKP
jgi:thiol-disulfide isomerase/thioredoxin